MKKNILTYCFIVLPLLIHAQINENDILIRQSDPNDCERYSYVNSKGKTIIPFDKYLLCFTDTIVDIGFVMKPHAGCIAINNKGEELFEVFFYDMGPDYPSNGLFRIYGKDKKIGYADMKGNIVIEPKYDGAWIFSNGLAIVGIGCRDEPIGENWIWAGGKWGIIDLKGNLVVPLEYDEIKSTKNSDVHRFLGRKNDQWVPLIELDN